MKKILPVLLGILLFLSGCSPEPRPINYGVDKCDFCKMTIVDKQHGAELVTVKGRVILFDAIECMVRYTEKDNAEAYAFLLVNDFENPEAFLDATTCFYLQSEQIPSPMGAFLSAFKTKNAAEKIQKLKTGIVYEWKELPKALKNQAY